MDQPTHKHRLQCSCGKFGGYVVPHGAGNRAICYCNDCQAFARYLGVPGLVLDPQGGTEIVAIVPRFVKFTHGVENLACMSLSPKGLLRWYASCCNTPIGNTPRTQKLAYVGLVAACLQDPQFSTGQSFGPVRLALNVDSARVSKGQKRPEFHAMSAIFAMARIVKDNVVARLSGTYRQTPFFNRATGVPVTRPKVLTPDERERVTPA